MKAEKADRAEAECGRAGVSLEDYRCFLAELLFRGNSYEGLFPVSSLPVPSELACLSE